MEFGNINDLKYIIIPILIILVIIFGIRKRELILKQINWNTHKNFFRIKMLLIIIGTIFLFIAFLSPQKLKQEKEVAVKGNDIYVLIDISKSMLAKDVYPNRLELSKIELQHIFEHLRGDRVGIIPFSDSAYIQMPLTDDYFMAKNYIGAIDSQLISGGGTKLLEAIELANQSFEKTKTKNKTVIIFSDGGERDKKLLNYVQENKIKVFVFGVGTRNGSVIETDKGFIKDNAGNIVISKLNDDFLQDVAKSTGGAYYSLNNLNTNNYKKLIKDLNFLKKSVKRQEKIKTYDKYYQYFLSVALFLILLGYFLKKSSKEE